MNETNLPADVLAALQRGDTIEAIKLLRAATGLGLKDAKDAIDRHRAGLPIDMPTHAANASLPLEVTEALARNRKIEAIRLLRERTGMGLKEAKDAVEAHTRSWPGDPLLAPGEVPRSGAAKVIVVLLFAVAAYMAYRWWAAP